jgi:EpsI family protein
MPTLLGANMKTRLILLCLILLVASMLIARASKPEETPIRESLSGMPTQIGDWKERQESELAPNVLAILRVDDYVNRIYYNPALFPASLYIGYYKSQREGDAIHSPLNCLPGAGWNPIKNSHVKISANDGSEIEINRIVIMKGMEKQTVLYWYQSHGRVIASEYWGKIYTVIDALRTNRTDAALVRVICPVAGSDAKAEETAEKQAVDFVKSLYPLIGRFIPE